MFITCNKKNIFKSWANHLTVDFYKLNSRCAKWIISEILRSFQPVAVCLQSNNFANKI